MVDSAAEERTRGVQSSLHLCLRADCGFSCRSKASFVFRLMSEWTQSNELKPQIATRYSKAVRKRAVNTTVLSRVERGNAVWGGRFW